MTTAAPTEYELVLMLDPEASDEVRDRIVAEARGRIEAGGTVKNDTAWGLRKMAYEIQRRTEADYRFFRFEGEPTVLESLDHDLKIADGVLRFRIFKVDARSPVTIPPAPGPGSVPSDRPARRGEEDGAPAEAPAAEAPAEPAPAPPAEPAAAEPAPETPAEPASAEPVPEAPAEPAPEAPAEPAAAEPVPEAPAEEPAAEEPAPEAETADGGQEPA